MDAIVSARVPVAVKERGNSILKELGATPSQLVNAAYEYVLAEGKLPQARSDLERLRGTVRTLDAGQREKIARSLRVMNVGCVDQGRSFKELLDEARDDRYARFA